MATFKHISSKNADYGDAEKYLTFAHDEFTMKPTLDAEGRLVPRGDYRISTLNCGEEDFAVACMRSNLRYGKNQKREDVKSHHYIISFDPRDGPDNGLTVDKAQELGERFCREQFPGHQAIVCTHPDGHNQSGNIHVHIVINSLRIENVPLLPYMDRPADTKAGCKHRCTDAAMEYFKSEVMELCHEAGLYQIDLLNGSANRVTEREYWVKKKGQAALDQENAALAAEGKPTKPTRFETDKEKLRQIIRKTLNESFTVEDFARKLLQYGVIVKESRGRFSYLTPDRTKPITARKLGDSFDKAAVLAALEQNVLRSEHTLTSNDAIRVYKTTRDGKRLTLEDECLQSCSLPSIAYGFKRCSLKHKIGPQEKFCNHYPPCQKAWAAGKRVVKFIGYDAGEGYRSDKVLLGDLADRKYSKWYPLMEWGWTRDDCIRQIEAAGLPQPGKSSCFFCPSMKPDEITALREQHPDLFRRALALEDNARKNLKTVKGLGRNYSWRERFGKEFCTHGNG